MYIEKATLDDVPALCRLINTAYRGEESLKGWANEGELIDGVRIDEETLIEYISDSNIVILKYTNPNDEIEACVYLENRVERMYLGMLTVLPTLQDKGLGRQLLFAAEKYAVEQGCTVMEMTVITVRHSLIDWYLRRGYHLTGRKQPFHDGGKFGVPRQPLELAVLEKAL